MKKALLLALIVATVAFMAGSAMAAPSGNPSVQDLGAAGVNTRQYHSYDGLICTDCHTLHNSDGGAAIAGNKAQTNWTNGAYRELLKKGDWTDMCLSCHKQGYNTSATADLVGVENSGWTAPIVMTLDGTVPAGVAMPAGDFYWSNLDPKKGHNPAYTKGATAATSLLMASDPTLTTVPPGGTGDILAAGKSEEWGCHSCHGMHARFSNSYTAWRQLQRKVNGIVTTGNETATTYGVETSGGDKGTTAVGYEPILSNSRGDVRGGANNTNYVTTRADGNPNEGASLFADYGDTNKNVYRGGFSSFCSACHGLFHGTTTTEGGGADNTQNASGIWSKHPTNIVMGPVSGTRKYGMTTYNKAVSNAQSNNPNPAGYDFKYPLVQPTSGAGAFDVTVTGAGGTLHNEDRIMCLTCHQSHASPFENMTRWDANGHAFLPVGTNEASAIVGGANAATTGDNIAFGCGKCHQKGGTKAFVKSF